MVQVDENDNIAALENLALASQNGEEALALRKYDIGLALQPYEVGGEVNGEKRYAVTSIY